MAEFHHYLDKAIREHGEPAELMEAYRLTLNTTTSTAPAYLFPALHLIAEATEDVMRERQRIYGSGNIDKFKLMGVVIRMHDKLERLRTMVFEGKECVDENVEDSLCDLANYACIGLLLSRNWWRLPFVDEVE